MFSKKEVLILEISELDQMNNSINSILGFMNSLENEVGILRRIAECLQKGGKTTKLKSIGSCINVILDHSNDSQKQVAAVKTFLLSIEHGDELVSGYYKAVC